MITPCLRFYYDLPKGEDYLVLGTRTFGIIDGATPHGTSRRALLDYIRSLSYYITKYEDQPLYKSIKYALDVTFFPDHKKIPVQNRPSASAAIVRIHEAPNSKIKIEWFRAEDVFLIINNEEYTQNFIKHYDDQNWKEMKNYMKKGDTFEEAHAKTIAKIIQTRELIGKKYFPLFPGRQIKRDEVHTIILDPPVHIAAMSDGYYRYFLLKNIHPRKIFNLDPWRVIKELRKLEKRTPTDKLPYAGFSVHDDASLLIIEIGTEEVE